MGDARRRLELEPNGKGNPCACGVPTVLGVHSPERCTQYQPKIVQPGGMAADESRRLVIFRARGPLDLEDTYFALGYAQLKHLAGQLIEQEAAAELIALSRRPEVSPT